MKKSPDGQQTGRAEKQQKRVPQITMRLEQIEEAFTVSCERNSGSNTPQETGYGVITKQGAVDYSKYDKIYFAISSDQI